MSFERQSKEYSCGAASLRYALTFLGKAVDEADLLKLSQTSRNGTDEAGIAKAAARYGCEAVMRNYRRFSAAFKSLVGYVQKGQPCILCVKSWMHWVVVAGANNNGVAIFDPYSTEVAALIKPETLYHRWKHFKGGEEDPHFFFIAIRPRARRLCPKGVADNELVRALCGSRDLREEWDRYLRDLMNIFNKRHARAKDCYPAWQLISRNTEKIIEAVSLRNKEASRRLCRKELKNLILVCKTYDFTTRPREEKRILKSLACVLSRSVLKQ